MSMPTPSVVADLGYSGTYNERLIQFLGDAGYTGSINERLYKYLSDQYGSGNSLPGLLSLWAADGWATIAMDLDFGQEDFEQTLSGSLSLTQSNADVWTVTDHEGVVRTVPQNAYPRGGLRMVRNLLAEQSISSVDLTTFPNFGQVNGVRTATTLEITGTNNSYAAVYNSGKTYAIGTKLIMSCDVTYISGDTSNLLLRFFNSAVSANDKKLSLNFTVSTTYRVAMPLTIATTASSVQMSIDNRAGIFPGYSSNPYKIGITNILLQDVTGRAVTTVPDSYISSAATQPSSGIAGFAYYDTTNGNTVDGSGVVTEGTGTAITGGYLSAQEARTNLVKGSSDFSNATYWTANGTVNADNIAGPDGTTTADQVSAAGTAFTLYSAATTVSASTTYTFSFYAKLGTMTGPLLAVYDLTNLAFISSDVSYTPSSSEFTRVTHTFTTPVGCVSVRVYPLRNSSGSGTIWFWGAQLEAGSFATNYIPTTTATVARTAMTLTAPNPLKDAQGAVYFEFNLTVASTSQANKYIWQPAPASSVGLYFHSGNQKLSTYDGTTLLQATTLAADTTYKVVLTWSGSSMLLVVNGTTYSAAYDGTLTNSTTQAIGSSLGGSAANMRIFAFRGYKTALTQAQAEAMTS